MSPPGLLAPRLARGAVVRLRHHCPRVKRDGTAGLVGCWIRRPPKAAPPSRRVRPPASIALDRGDRLGQPTALRSPRDHCFNACLAGPAVGDAAPLLHRTLPYVLDYLIRHIL